MSRRGWTKRYHTFKEGYCWNCGQMLRKIHGYKTIVYDGVEYNVHNTCYKGTKRILGVKVK